MAVGRLGVLSRQSVIGLRDFDEVMKLEALQTKKYVCVTPEGSHLIILTIHDSGNRNKSWGSPIQTVLVLKLKTRVVWEFWGDVARLLSLGRPSWGPQAFTRV